jgi:hypothetical protein
MFCQQALFKEISKLGLLPAGISAIKKSQFRVMKNVPHLTPCAWKSY